MINLHLHLCLCKFKGNFYNLVVTCACLREFRQQTVITFTCDTSTLNLNTQASDTCIMYVTKTMMFFQMREKSITVFQLAIPFFYGYGLWYHEFQMAVFPES